MFKFKQYRHGKVQGTYHIHAFKGNNAWFLNRQVSDILELENVTADECRKASVCFMTDECVTIDPEDMLVFSVPEQTDADQENNYLYARQYVAALNGCFANRKLLMVLFYDDRICLRYGVFGEDGKPTDFVVINLDHLPKGTVMTVSMSRLGGETHDRLGTPDTYEIRNLAERDEPMRITISEIRDSKLRRMRQLGRDDRGEYEIISEMDV